jgi:hypothetical protein
VAIAPSGDIAVLALLALLALLADRGRRRAPSIPDLITAATAGLAGLTVLHLDKDFDLIAAITGQPMDCLSGMGLSNRPARIRPLITARLAAIADSMTGR